MEKVEIDLKNGTATTPAGLAPEREVITASQDQSATEQAKLQLCSR